MLSYEKPELSNYVVLQIDVVKQILAKLTLLHVRHSIS